MMRHNYRVQGLDPGVQALFETCVEAITKTLHEITKKENDIGLIMVVVGTVLANAPMHSPEFTGIRDLFRKVYLVVPKSFDGSGMLYMSMGKSTISIKISLEPAEL